MAKFHKVVTRVTDRRCSITYAGEVEAEIRPECKCTETFRVDIYEDFFNTREEAELFIRTQSRQL